jgi:iron complex outermembrane receptor protein
MRSGALPLTAGWVLFLGIGAASARALAAPRTVTPPVVEERADAVHPQEAGARTRAVIVDVDIAIDAAGRVTEAVIAQSGGSAFDDAAVAAARRWRFRPATRDGAPVASKNLRLRFPFAPHQPGQVTPATPSLPAAPADAGTPAEAAVSAPKLAEPESVDVRGRRLPPSRGASDFNLRVGALRRVFRASAGELLTLAPGILLTNEGGEGHASQIFLRGFDARQGQDLEVTVDGVPVNEAGNLHGNGYADTHFILPELVTSLRVLEGPFDPRQGNFAVAGSADYHLGLEQRGFTGSLRKGSFGTGRLVALWGPAFESERTFAGAEIYQSDGFGANRASERASAIGQYEGRLGEHGTWRLVAQGYATKYQTAGVVRQDDLRAGRVDFYGTYDPRQGGSSNRFSIAADLETRRESASYALQAFVVQRSMRLLENFTGFREDDQEAIRRPHPQRGDLLDLTHQATTFGARASARFKGRVLERPYAFESGLLARGDAVEGTQQRLEATSSIPYRTEQDLGANLANVGLYGDAELKPTPWVTARGGARVDLFTFDVDDRCAAQEVSRPPPDSPTGDASCLTQSRFGRYREPNQRATTIGTRMMPRATVLIGPFRGFTLSGAYGQGIRSIDPVFVTQDIRTPFAAIEAWDGGVTYARKLGALRDDVTDSPGAFADGAVVLRSIFFGTHVDRDLLFNPTTGRNTLATGTTRTGWAGTARYTSRALDQSASVTLVRSTFDDTGLLVPYVPDVVVRSDTAVHGDLPFRFAGAPLRAALSSGVTYVGRRALPFGERSQSIFTIDASASVGYRNIDLGVVASNVLDARYRLSELNYASSFRQGAPPDLVASRHFTAGPPRMLFATVTVTLGGDG